MKWALPEVFLWDKAKTKARQIIDEPHVRQYYCPNDARCYMARVFKPRRWDQKSSLCGNDIYIYI